MTPSQWITHLLALTAHSGVYPAEREDSIAPQWKLSPEATQAKALAALQVLSLLGQTSDPNAPGYAHAAEQVRSLIRLIPPRPVTSITAGALKPLAGASLHAAADRYVRPILAAGHPLDESAIARLIAAELVMTVPGLRMTRALRHMALVAVQANRRAVERDASATVERDRVSVPA